MTTRIDDNSLVADATQIDNTDSPYLTQDEQEIQVDTSSGSVTVTLATADLASGREIKIIDSGLNAGTNNITIETEGTETINPGGSSSVNLTVDGTFIKIWSDGNNWFTDRNVERDLLNTDELDATRFFGGEWTEGADSGTNRSEGVAVSNNGVVYYGLGWDGSTTYSDWNRYDPEADTHTSLTAMPSPSRNATAVEYSGKVYVFGGFDGSNAISTTYIYDIGGDSWSTGASYPNGATDDMMAGEVNGTIYVGGGNNGGSVSAQWEAYDPSVDSWTTKTNLPKAVEGAGMTTNDGKVYVVGGSDTDHNPLQDAYAYDPAGDSWIQLPNPPQTGIDPSMMTLRGEPYLLGGWVRVPDAGSGSTDTATATRAVCKLTDADEWVRLTSLPMAARWNIQAAATDEILVLIGGVQNFPSQDPQSDVWTTSGGFEGIAVEEVKHRDVSGVRSTGTQYVNQTGRPMQVYVTAFNDSASMQLLADVKTDPETTTNNEVWRYQNSNTPTEHGATVSLAVPPGYIYRIRDASSSAVTIANWYEFIL